MAQAEWFRGSARRVDDRRALIACLVTGEIVDRDPQLLSGRMSRSGNIGVGYVNKDQILVHPLRIDRSLVHQQVFCSDQAMLHSGRKMKPVARSERLNRQGFVGGIPIQDEPCAFLHFQVFVLFLMHFKSEVATLTNDEILFNTGVFVENDHYASPRCLDDPVATPLDAVEEFGKKGGGSDWSMVKVLPPEQAGLATIVVEGFLGVDARLRAQATRDGCKPGVPRQLTMI